MKNKPERTCSVCGKKAEKSDFLRVVKNKEGMVLIDYTMKADGRGAYICKNSEWIRAAAKKRALERSFKSKIDSDIYIELEKATVDSGMSGE